MTASPEVDDVASRGLLLPSVAAAAFLSVLGSVIDAFVVVDAALSAANEFDLWIACAIGAVEISGEEAESLASAAALLSVLGSVIDAFVVVDAALSAANEFEVSAGCVVGAVEISEELGAT